jgi:hypothetical protein
VWEDGISAILDSAFAAGGVVDGVDFDFDFDVAVAVAVVDKNSSDTIELGPVDAAEYYFGT